MKNIKKLFATFLTVILVLMSFPIFSTVQAEESTQQKAITHLDFEMNAGWSGSNGSQKLSWMNDPSDTDNHVMQMASNGPGYNMELADAADSKIAYKLLPETSYTVTFRYMPVSGFENGAYLALVLGAGATSGKVELKREWFKGKSESWYIFTYTFTTTKNQYASDYNPKATTTGVVNRLYLSFPVDNSTKDSYVYIDDIRIINNDIPIRTVSYNFQNNTGLSNIANQQNGFAEYVNEGEDGSNIAVKLTSKGFGGSTVELANTGYSTTLPYTLLPNTKYTVSFKYKLDEDSYANRQISLILGSQFQYDPNQPKFGLKVLNLSAENDYDSWHTFTYSFTTTENLYYNELITTSKYNHVCNKLFISYNCGVQSDTTTGGSIYIDDIMVTNKDVDKPKLTSNYDFQYNTGISNKANAGNAKCEYFVDPHDNTNICVASTSRTSGGCSFELASQGYTNTPAYTLTPSTSYTVTFRYKVKEGSHNKKVVSLNTGSQFDYDPNQPKSALKLVDISNINDYNKWYTFTHTFTTTENLRYNEYNPNSKYTHVCNKLYISFSCGDINVAGSEGTLYIDDVSIINNDVDAVLPETDIYEIKSFTHQPYSACKIGTVGDGRVSNRMYSTTDGDNSVLAYQLALHPQHITEGFTSNGEGVRGNYMATACGYSATNLITSDENPIEIFAGYAYKVSLKYKVVKVEDDSYIGFSVGRGKCETGWTPYTAPSTVGLVTFGVEHAPTDGWKETHYTFFADFSTSLNDKYFKLAMVGFGECLIDDIKVEIIDRSQVEKIVDTSDYSFLSNSGKVTITEYNGTDTNIEIPAFFTGAKLTEIGKGSFIHCDTIESIKIPYGTEIIGSYAFEKTYSLKNISIPSSVTSIGERVFYDTPSLMEIIVDSDNENYVSVDGVLYNKDKTVLIAYPSGKTESSFTVPDTVTQISTGAFSGAVNLTEVILSKNLKVIGEKSFENCSGLLEIEIPSSVSKIDNSAFRSCTSLQEVVMSEGIQIGENVFFGCTEYYSYGDIDSNKTIDAQDIVKLAKVLAERNDTTLDYGETLAADVNRDGVVDMLDAAILKRHSAGLAGYEQLPSVGRKNETYEEYSSDSENAELVLNFTNAKSDVIVSNRDIDYDENKEDVMIVLVIGQSNNATNVGYSCEYEKYVAAYGEEPTAPTRPDEATVYSGTVITELTEETDAYYLCDTETMGTKTIGSSIPALGKSLHDATGAKIVFIRAARGATGMHEWVKDPENYKCTCSNNGNGKLYSDAVRNYLKSYYSLKEEYNIISTGYYWCQGEHEDGYAIEGNTIHDMQSYYDAFVSMHTTLLEDCEFDYGSIFMPRSYYKNARGWSSTMEGTEAEKEFDTVERSRCVTVARQAMYRAANDISNLFVASNLAETMKWGDDDISSTIHYAQKTYNAIGEQAAKSILSHLDIIDVPEFTGVKVYNSQGEELAVFDSTGNILSGSKTVDITNEDNLKLQISIVDVGTYYSYDIGYNNVECFSDEYFVIDAEKLLNSGYNSFDIVINSPIR